MKKTPTQKVRPISSPRIQPTDTIYKFQYHPRWNDTPYRVSYFAISANFNNWTFNSFEWDFILRRSNPKFNKREFKIELILSLRIHFNHLQVRFFKNSLKRNILTKWDSILNCFEIFIRYRVANPAENFSGTDLFLRQA